MLLPFAFGALVCVLHKDLWSEDCELVTLGSWTLDGLVVPLLWLWEPPFIVVLAPRLVEPFVVISGKVNLAFVAKVHRRHRVSLLWCW